MALGNEWPEFVDPLLTLLSCVSRRVSPTAEALAALEAALTSSRVALYDTASYIAQDASGFDTRTVDLVIGRSKHQKAHARRNAILCLGAETLAATTLEVIERGLKDRSALVRMKATDWALRLRLGSALPKVAAAMQVEHHAEARWTMEYTLGLLRDGYFARPTNSEYVPLTVLGNGGGDTIVRVKQSMIDEVGLDKMASEIRGAPYPT